MKNGQAYGSIKVQQSGLITGIENVGTDIVNHFAGLFHKHVNPPPPLVVKEWDFGDQGNIVFVLQLTPQTVMLTCWPLVLVVLPFESILCIGYAHVPIAYPGALLMTTPCSSNIQGMILQLARVLFSASDQQEG